MNACLAIFLSVYITYLPFLFAQTPNVPTSKDSKSSKESKMTEQVVEAQFKSATEGQVDRMIKSLDGSIKPEIDCSETTGQKKKNRFDEFKDSLLKTCREKLGYLYTGELCEKVVKDIFEVGSPYCQEGDEGSAAKSCTMGQKFLEDQFIQDKNNLYSNAVREIDKALKRIASGETKIEGKSLYEVILKACGNNKTLAINIISAGQVGFAGYSNFAISIEGKVPQDVFNIIDGWAKKGGLTGVVSERYPKIGLIPEKHRASISESKGYHYWARAMLATNLLDKGYPGFVSRAFATSTAMYYELNFDWKEHKAQGQGNWDNLSGAVSDIKLADCGSQLGADADFFLHSCEPSMMERVFSGF